MTRFLALDPSGNHSSKEGFGTTGWALFENGKLDDFGHIEACMHNSIESYWKSIVDKTTAIGYDAVVCESYNLQGHKAKQQSGSALETPQLIGAIRLHLYTHSSRTKFIFQSPKDKVRVTDEILVHMGVLEQTAGGRYRALGRQTIIHERDAIRHGIYHIRYGGKKHGT